VTVTETFQAVTPRMLESAQATAKSELVPAAALAGSTGSAAVSPSTAGSSSSAIRQVGGLKTRQKEVGFQILAGAAHKLHASLEAGAVGGILAFACPAPTACYEVYAAWKEGNQELARGKQERITQAAIRVASELGISALKYAMDLNGYYGGLARLPLLPLTASLKAEVEQAMADIRN
jgi:dihydrodipicolinate synthase/N-acetylneuraminate lyase